MYGKFRQIAKFIEIVDHSIQSGALNKQQALSVLDVGSGKGYLTFALYDYLSGHWSSDVSITGVDTKSDVVALLQHGLFIEKQADLITDVARTLLLESRGYTVKIIEFVSSEHSMKNTLIVAEKSKGAAPEKLDEYLALRSHFGFESQRLEMLLRAWFKIKKRKYNESEKDFERKPGKRVEENPSQKAG